MEESDKISQAYKILILSGIQDVKWRGQQDNVLNAMEEYAELKCKEQRELCFKEMKHHKFGFYKAKKDTILNAPSPKFDKHD